MNVFSTYNTLLRPTILKRKAKLRAGTFLSEGGADAEDHLLPSGGYGAPFHFLAHGYERDARGQSR